jgi:hypothetical protein
MKWITVGVVAVFAVVVILMQGVRSHHHALPTDPGPPTTLQN